MRPPTCFLTPLSPGVFICKVRITPKVGLRIQGANTGGVGAVLREQGCAVVTRTDWGSVTSGKRGRRG